MDTLKYDAKVFGIHVTKTWLKKFVIIIDIMYITILYPSTTTLPTLEININILNKNYIGVQNC